MATLKITCLLPVRANRLSETSFFYSMCGSMSASLPGIITVFVCINPCQLPVSIWYIVLSLAYLCRPWSPQGPGTRCLSHTCQRLYHVSMTICRVSWFQALRCMVMKLSFVGTCCLDGMVFVISNRLKPIK